MVNGLGGLMVRVSGMHTPCSKQERERKERGGEWAGKAKEANDLF